jgi:hypothetical protein
MELQEIDMEISSSLAVDGSRFVNADALDNDFSDSEII